MVPLRPLSRERIGATTRAASTRASTCSSTCSRVTVQPERSSRWAGSPITIHGSCVASHRRDMRSRRMDTGIAASTPSHPKNFAKMFAHPKRCSKMSAVTPSGDSARPTFRFARDVNGRSTSCSKKVSATIPVCSPFVVRDTAIGRRRLCRTSCIVRRELCMSCRLPRRRGAARAFPPRAARICVTSRSVSFVTASVNTRIRAYQQRSICIRGSWIPTSLGSLSAGSPRRATTADSRGRVRAWSSCSRSSALRRQRDA